MNEKAWVFEIYYNNISYTESTWHRHSKNMRFKKAVEKMTAYNKYDLNVVRIRNVRTGEIVPGALFV